MIHEIRHIIIVTASCLNIISVCKELLLSGAVCFSPDGSGKPADHGCGFS